MMNHLVVARELLAVAKELVSKVYPHILTDSIRNHIFWRKIESIAADVADISDFDDSGVRSRQIVLRAASELAHKYLAYWNIDTIAPDQNLQEEFENLIIKMIWEEYHNMGS